MTKDITGYNVRVLDGIYKGQEGTILYMITHNNAAISTKNPPEKNYDLRESISNLEMILKK